MQRFHLWTSAFLKQHHGTWCDCHCLLFHPETAAALCPGFREVGSVVMATFCIPSWRADFSLTLVSFSVSLMPFPSPSSWKFFLLPLLPPTVSQLIKGLLRRHPLITAELRWSRPPCVSSALIVRLHLPTTSFFGSFQRRSDEERPWAAEVQFSG